MPIVIHPLQPLLLFPSLFGLFAMVFILLHAGLLLHFECVPLESLCYSAKEAGLLIPSQFRGGVRAHTPNTNTRPS